MKRLYLTRHAKSDWGHEGLQDIDRPLNQRGYEDAYRMANSLKRKNHLPELIISSPATRAISTAFIFARAFEYPETRVVISRAVYEAAVNVLKEQVRNIPDKYSVAMLFGHNPGLTRLFNEAGDSELDNLPTCGVVLLEFETDSWKTVFDKKGKAVYSEFPKDFKP